MLTRHEDHFFRTQQDSNAEGTAMETPKKVGVIQEKVGVQLLATICVRRYVARVFVFVCLFIKQLPRLYM